MKKLFALTAALLLAATFGFSQKFSFQLFGGMGNVKGGDLMDGLRGQSSLLHATLGTKNNFLAPKNGLNFGGEFIFYPWRNFGIGLGGGYFGNVKKSEVTYGIGPINVTETIKPAFDVIPITLNLHYYLPLSSRLKASATAGGGYYIATLKWDYQMKYEMGSGNGDETYKFSSKQHAWGYQGGLGLEYALSSRISIALSGAYRHVILGPFSSGTWSDSGTGMYGDYSSSGSDHSFWLYTYAIDGVKYTRLAFQAETPTGNPAISGARTAKLDLTGFAATIGLKIWIGR